MTVSFATWYVRAMMTFIGMLYIVNRPFLASPEEGSPEVFTLTEATSKCGVLAAP
jgi:hypothetical protein